MLGRSRHPFGPALGTRPPRAKVFDEAFGARGGHRQGPVMDSRPASRVDPVELNHRHNLPYDNRAKVIEQLAMAESKFADATYVSDCRFEIVENDVLLR